MRWTLNLLSLVSTVMSKYFLSPALSCHLLRDWETHFSRSFMRRAPYLNLKTLTVWMNLVGRSSANQQLT